MEPLAELDENWIHPVLKTNIKKILKNLDDQNIKILNEKKLVWFFSIYYLLKSLSTWRFITMARVTVEDCVKKIPNRFDLVIAAAQRSREISNGISIEVDRDNDKNPVVSLREIASEAVDAESLQERFIRSMQKNLIKEDNNIEEEASLEEEFAAYLNESKSETKTNDDFILNKIKQVDEGSFEDISEEKIKNED